MQDCADSGRLGGGGREGLLNVVYVEALSHSTIKQDYPYLHDLALHTSQTTASILECVRSRNVTAMTADFVLITLCFAFCMCEALICVLFPAGREVEAECWR